MSAPLHGSSKWPRLTIDIAEATCFTLLGVMQTTSPVDSNVAFAAVQAGCALHCATCADTAKLEQAVKHGTVIADVVFALLLSKVVHVVWRDLVQKVDVLVCVELRHLVLGGRFGALQLSVSIAFSQQTMGATHVDFHLGVQSIIHDQAVGHAYAVRLHGMAGHIGVVADIRVVEVRDFLWLRRGAAEDAVGPSAGRHVFHGAGESQFAAERVGDLRDRVRARGCRAGSVPLECDEVAIVRKA